MSKCVGFTLIELLLVAVLLSVLASVVFPRLKGSARAAELEEAAQQLAHVVLFARAEAVRRQLKVQLHVTDGGDGYGLMLQDAEQSYQEMFIPFGDALLDEEREFPRGVQMNRIRQGDQTERSNTIVFTPDGVSSPYTLELLDDGNRRAFVEIGTWYDEVAVTRHAREGDSGNAT